MPGARIELLDLIRGAAVLGILLMNIRLFSEPYAVYFNPQAIEQQSDSSLTWWCFQYLVADQKFMAIFSMLFGASTALICDKLILRGINPWFRYCRRLFILLLIGLFHAYIIWHGDILTFYALCGLVPLLFLRFNWPVPISVGLLILLLGSIKSFGSFQTLVALPQGTLNQIIGTAFSHSILVNQVEIMSFQGNWLEQWAMRFELATHFHFSSFLAWGIYRVTGLMLVGLGLYRAGFFTGKFSLQQYAWIALFTLAFGFCLSIYGLVQNLLEGWVFPNYFFKNALWNYWGSLLVACGYVSLLAIISKRKLFAGVQESLQNIGKAALSNYLLQSVLCTAWFYGFSQFAKTSALQSLLVIAAVWCVQVAATNWWLKYHQMGPIEYLWRRWSGEGTKARA